jgi:NADH:ubiquinone oxidoreductase subunit H
MIICLATLPVVFFTLLDRKPIAALQGLKGKKYIKPYKTLKLFAEGIKVFLKKLIFSKKTKKVLVFFFIGTGILILFFISWCHATFFFFCFFNINCFIYLVRNFVFPLFES